MKMNRRIVLFFAELISFILMVVAYAVRGYAPNEAVNLATLITQNMKKHFIFLLDEYEPFKPLKEWHGTY